MAERPTKQLRKLLARAGCILAPGAGDALMARLIAQAGYEVVYLSGFATSVQRLGMPDIGLLTASEMIDNAARVYDACGLPVEADADTGYGNAINVRRTVREYEKAGVAALHLEDQVAPKRCGHLEGKRVISTDEMIGKIKAACDARHDQDLLLIIRTDALAIEGVAATFERAERYREAGADMLFIESPNREQCDLISARFKGFPLLYNMASSGKSPPLSIRELGELGFNLANFALYGLRAAIPAIQTVLLKMKQDGSIANLEGLVSFRELTDLVGLPEIQQLERRYGTPEDQVTKL